MKRILLVVFALGLALPAFADLKGDMRRFYGIVPVVGESPYPNFVNGVQVGGVALTTTGLDSTTTGITAHAGGGQASAVALTTVFNNVTTCTTAGDSVKLLTAAAGVRQVVKNSGATTLAVFPNTSDSINALAVNLSVDVAPGSTVTFHAISATVWETQELITLPAPSTQKGNFVLKAADNSANYTVTLVNAAYGQASTITLPDPGGAAASIVLTEGTQTINGVKTFGSAPVASGASITAGTIPRASLAEDALQAYPLSFYNWVDSSVLPLTTPAATGKFGLSAVGTGVLGLASVDVDNTSETPTMSTQFVLPPEYVAAGDVRVIITAKVTTGPASVKTIDVVANEVAVSAGTVGADICATAVQTLTTSFAEYSFTITAAGLVAGDTLQITVDGSITDSAGGATTTLQITGIRVVCDIKG